jgi:hypothetical protein
MLGEHESPRFLKSQTLLEQYAKDTLLAAHDADGRLPACPSMTEAEIIDVLRSAL